ncbi:PilW family protein [Verrucomicrobiota bacterium sgz303538]
MKLKKSGLFGRLAGASIMELTISTAISTVVAGGLLVGMNTIQRSFKAAQYHAKSQIEQTRLLDYISRDLRMALTVNVDTFEGSKRITVTVPDFYDSDNVPRNPVISKGKISYGDPTKPVTISYFKSGASIYRSVNGTNTIMATEVDDFVMDYTDDGKQAIGVTVSFVPKFQLNTRDTSTLRTGTATFSNTLLRNKREQKTATSK